MKGTILRIMTRTTTFGLGRYEHATFRLEESKPAARSSTGHPSEQGLVLQQPTKGGETPTQVYQRLSLGHCWAGTDFTGVPLKAGESQISMETWTSVDIRFTFAAAHEARSICRCIPTIRQRAHGTYYHAYQPFGESIYKFIDYAVQPLLRHWTHGSIATAHVPSSNVRPAR